MWRWRDWVIEAFNAASGNQRITHMFDVLGKKTISCMSDGCLRLAALWASAWKEGSGNDVPATKLGAVARKDLIKLYNDPAFLPALRMTDSAFAAELT